MKTIIITISLIIGFSVQGYSQQDQKLAARILADKKLDTVYARAIGLLSKGFNAGDGYPQVWIRDFNTFIETSCKVYNHDSIRTNLLTFLRLQQPNGEIVDGYVLKGHVTWNDPNIYTSPYDSTHVGFKNTVETDQETSLIQAIAKYIRVTGDRSILKEMIAGKTALQRLELSIAYLLKNR
jgi:GH15 family glucan-1,4-alpha-glucosidase